MKKSVLHNDEMKEIIKLMPPWKPGKHNEKAVAVHITLPFKFLLIK